LDGPAPAPGARCGAHVLGPSVRTDNWHPPPGDVSGGMLSTADRRKRPMWFFKTSGRSRSRRSPAAVRARLGVEQLEARLPVKVASTGAEALVNTYTPGIQQTTQGAQAVAVDSAGDSIITWSSTGQDGSGSGVYAQHYSAEGTAIGSEFRVNTTS